MPQSISFNDLVERYVRLAVHLRRLALLERVFQLAIAKLVSSVLIRDKLDHLPRAKNSQGVDRGFGPEVASSLASANCFSEGSGFLRRLLCPGLRLGQVSPI